MARLVPTLDESELTLLASRAEANFYRVCRDDLPADWLVLFSVPWVSTTIGGRPHDGEADFVVLVPGSGMLVIEVKGGGVEFDPSAAKWYSTDRHAARHLIKDPFKQAVQEKATIIDMLRSDARWRAAHSGWLTAGHAVLFPDVDRVEGVVGPMSPREIVGGRSEMATCRRWIEQVLQYWAGGSSHSHSDPGLSRQAMAVVELILCKRLEARPLVSTRLAQEEAVRITLTEQQSRVLRAIGTRKQAAVCGGAGTGKTLLALDRACACARDGMKTLLLSYNRLLADYFKHAALGQDGLYAMSYHQLCEWRTALGFKNSGRDLISEARVEFPSRGDADYFDRQLPYALALSTEVLDERFDAIVVDEGQDFRDEYWLGVQLLMRSEVESRLYVFYDQNQTLYSRTGSIPIGDEPFLLSFNCRNTHSIHQFAYQFFRGEVTDPPPGNIGVPLEFISAPSVGSQADVIHAAIVRLLVQEKVEPRQIAVLVCGQPKCAYYDALKDKALPRGVAWSFEGAAVATGLRVDTVRRFKGLEADIVFLWGVDTMPSSDRIETLYVGASRAKSRLNVVGRADSLLKLQTGVVVAE